MEEQIFPQIDYKKVLKAILSHKKTIIISTVVTGIVAAFYIVQIPRTYTSEVMLAPETDNAGAGGTLSSLASSFGFDLGAMQSADAIYPMLYPDLFESNDFVVDLFSINVKTIDGSLSTDYYDYLANHQDYPFWAPAVNWVKRLLKPATKNQKIVAEGEEYKIDPFRLTEREDMIVEGVKQCIKCSVDKKTDVITISVVDQDPLICATMADSVCGRLQHFITQYRTSKSRADHEYYSKLLDEAKAEYDEAILLYSEFCDSHRNSILQTDISYRDKLENDMQSKFDTYSILSKQLQAANAKIQETTPAFTVLQNASVPIKPTGPKRMIFVIAMMFLAFVISSVCVLRKIVVTKTEEAS